MAASTRSMRRGRTTAMPMSVPTGETYGGGIYSDLVLGGVAWCSSKYVV